MPPDNAQTPLETLYPSEPFFFLSMDPLCIAGTDGYFKRVNPAFTAILGWEEKELLSKPFMDFVTDDTKKATGETIMKLSSGLSTVRFEDKFKCKDGSFRWLSWTCGAAKEGMMYAVARDVTKDKEMVDQLLHRTQDAEKLNKLTINRELKMVEMKNEIEELKKKLGPA